MPTETSEKGLEAFISSHDRQMSHMAHMGHMGSDRHIPYVHMGVIWL